MNRVNLALMVLLLFPSAVLAGDLICDLHSSKDKFALYADWQIMESNNFRVFSMMGGLTLAVVNKESGNFNRISSFNLLPEPERLQQFQGKCHPMPENGQA